MKENLKIFKSIKQKNFELISCISFTLLQKGAAFFLIRVVSHLYVHRVVRPSVRSSIRPSVTKVDFQPLPFGRSPKSNLRSCVTDRNVVFFFQVRFFKFYKELEIEILLETRDACTHARTHVRYSHSTRFHSRATRFK